MRARAAIAKNVRAHDLVCSVYEEMHGEIFNEIEQARIKDAIASAAEHIQSQSSFREVLDYGCGTGNLTRQLIALGMKVVSADISDAFLSRIDEQFSQTGLSETLKINGEDLRSVQNNRFDLVAAYSVLHHIPDYLKAITELIRVTKPGGIVYIDHEVNEDYWNQRANYKEFRQIAGGGQPQERADLPQNKSPNPILRPRKYIGTMVRKMQRYLGLRLQSEGDIHVWPDDHIEWDKVEKTMIRHGCKILIVRDYLLYKKYYRLEVFESYKDRCSDMRMLVAQKQ